MPITYKDADERLTGRCKNSRKIGNHTYLERDESDSKIIHLRLHRSRIATLFPDGSIRLDSCGYMTITTMDRIRWVLPEHTGIYYMHGWWLIWSKLTDYCDNKVFADGMMIDPQGRISGYATETAKEKLSAYNKAKYQRNKLERVESVRHFTLGDVVRYQDGCFIIHRLYENACGRVAFTLKYLTGGVAYSRISTKWWRGGKDAITKDEFMTAVHRRGELREESRLASA